MITRKTRIPHRPFHEITVTDSDAATATDPSSNPATPQLVQRTTPPPPETDTATETTP